MFVPKYREKLHGFCHVAQSSSVSWVNYLSALSYQYIYMVPILDVRTYFVPRRPELNFANIPWMFRHILGSSYVCPHPHRRSIPRHLISNSARGEGPIVLPGIKNIYLRTCIASSKIKSGATIFFKINFYSLLFSKFEIYFW